MAISQLVATGTAARNASKGIEKGLEATFEAYDLLVPSTHMPGLSSAKGLPLTEETARQTIVKLDRAIAKLLKATTELPRVGPGLWANDAVTSLMEHLKASRTLVSKAPEDRTQTDVETAALLLVRADFPAREAGHRLELIANSIDNTLNPDHYVETIRREQLTSDSLAQVRAQAEQLAARS